MQSVLVSAKCYGSSIREGRILPERSLTNDENDLITMLLNDSHKYSFYTYINFHYDGDASEKFSQCTRNVYAFLATKSSDQHDYKF